MSIAKYITVEPRYNEVPRDWGNVFVITWVRYINEIPLHSEFVGKRLKSLLYWGLANNYFALKLNSVTLHHSAFSLIMQLLSGFERSFNFSRVMTFICYIGVDFKFGLLDCVRITGIALYRGSVPYILL